MRIIHLWSKMNCLEIESIFKHKQVLSLTEQSTIIIIQAKNLFVVVLLEFVTFGNAPS